MKTIKIKLLERKDLPNNVIVRKNFRFVCALVSEIKRAQQALAKSVQEARQAEKR